MDLTRLVGQPSIIGTTLLLGIALIVVHHGFWQYYAGKKYVGTAIVVCGVALALSDGFVTIAWIIRIRTG